MLLPNDIYQLLLGYLDFDTLSYWGLLNRREKERVERYAFAPIVIGSTGSMKVEHFCLSENYLILLYPSLSRVVVYDLQGISLYSLRGFPSILHSNGSATNILYSSTGSVDLNTGKRIDCHRYIMMEEPDESTKTLNIQELELSLRFISSRQRIERKDSYQCQGLARARLWGQEKEVVGLLLSALSLYSRSPYLWFPLPLTAGELALPDTAFALCRRLVIVFDDSKSKLSVFHGPLRRSWSGITGYQVRYNTGQYTLLLIGEKIELYRLPSRW